MTGSWSGQRRAFPTAMRRAILERDPLCVWGCGRLSTIADHIVPVAEGGTDTMTNGQGMCDPCHTIKTRAEINRGRTRSGQRRPTTTHPGLVARAADQ